MTESQSKPQSQFFFILACAVVGALAGVLKFSPDARELAFETGKMILAVITTPFFLEATIALFCIFVVAIINQWRLRREVDEWVYLPTTESSTEEADVASASQTPPPSSPSK